MKTYKVFISLLLFSYSLTISASNFDKKFKNLLHKSLPNVAVGLMLQDAHSGDILYSSRAAEGFTPASTTKLFTAAAALEYLKPDYCFETRLDFNKYEVRAGTLAGPLYLTFTGDPTLRSIDLKELFLMLKKNGVNKIAGSVYIDSSRFKMPVYAPGWSIDDVKWHYGAPISAIIIDKNKKNQTAVIDPQKMALKRIQSILRSANIKLEGKIKFNNSNDQAITKTNRSIIHYSDSLDKIVKYTLMHSNNISAESLLKTLGYYYHDSGNFQKGVLASQAILAPITGIDFSKMQLHDGSGLSHYNCLTPEHLAKLLYSMYHNSELKKVFMDALPIGGQSGTLKKRLTHKSQTGNVLAKTGSLHGKSALAGYLKHRDSNMILVIMINQSMAPQASMKRLEDDIVRLVLNSRFN